MSKLTEQGRKDIDSLRSEKCAVYEDYEGMTARIYCDDSNDYVGLKIFNRYGHKVGEAHFPYYYGRENPVKDAKDYLESQFPRMFRKA